MCGNSLFIFLLCESDAKIFSAARNKETQKDGRLTIDMIFTCAKLTETPMPHAFSCRQPFTRMKRKESLCRHPPLLKFLSNFVVQSAGWFPCDCTSLYSRLWCWISSQNPMTYGHGSNFIAVEYLKLDPGQQTRGVLIHMQYIHTETTPIPSTFPSCCVHKIILHLQIQPN